MEMKHTYGPYNIFLGMITKTKPANLKANKRPSKENRRER